MKKKETGYEAKNKGSIILVMAYIILDKEKLNFSVSPLTKARHESKSFVKLDKNNV